MPNTTTRNSSIQQGTSARSRWVYKYINIFTILRSLENIGESASKKYVPQAQGSGRTRPSFGGGSRKSGPKLRLSVIIIEKNAEQKGVIHL